MIKVGQKAPLFQMSDILKFDIQKKKTITLYENKISKPYGTSKTQICVEQVHFPLKGGTRTSSGTAGVDSNCP